MWLSCHVPYNNAKVQATVLDRRSYISLKETRTLKNMKGWEVGKNNTVFEK
jgi:hypothetical protein